MKRASRRLRLAILLSASFAGMLAAHAIDYSFIDPAHRHELLLGTGHGYWPYAGAIGLLAAVIAALTSIGGGFAEGRAAAPESSVLAVLQTGGFIALESIERIGAGTAGRGFGWLIALGIVLQIVVAFGISRMLRALARVAEVLGRAARAVIPVYVPVARSSVDIVSRRLSLRVASHPVRGPPLPAC